MIEVASNSVIAMPQQTVKPIQWSNALTWARKTAFTDRKHYHTQNRPMSVGRLWHWIVPNLKQPIFIIGAPRSGTTFLGSCVAEIPEISYHFEPVATKAASRCIYDQEWEFGKTKRFYNLVYAWLMRLHTDGDLRFAEKTPRNCFVIDFLRQAFPDAQFIHIVRDGRDVALSYSKKPWLQAASAKSGKTEPGGYAYGPYPRFWVEPDRVEEFEATSDIHRCVWAWRRFTDSALTACQQLPTAQYHELRYENLAKHPRMEAEKMLDFMGIKSATSCELFHQAVSRVRSDSVGQWQRELNAEQLSQIENEAGELLKRLNYLQ